MSASMLAALLLAQAAPAVSPGTEVRALTASILDAKGGPLADLGPTDVALVENGVARDITSFKPDARPVSMAILVDTSQAIESAFRLDVTPALGGFLARLAEGTRYAVWTTGDRPTKVQDFTEDKAAAREALSRVAPQGGNTLLDAVAEAAADLAKNAREGDRKVLVALTATGPELSHRDQYRAVDEAERGADLFLSVQIDAGEDDFDARSRLGYVLDRLEEETGGRNEVVLSPMSLDAAFRKLTAVLRGGYRLAYATVPQLKKRKLELSVARPGVKVLLPSAATPGS